MNKNIIELDAKDYKQILAEELHVGDIFSIDCGETDSLRGRGIEADKTYDIEWAQDCTVIAMNMGRATCVVWLEGMGAPGELVTFEVEGYEVLVTGKDTSIKEWENE